MISQDLHRVYDTNSPSHLDSWVSHLKQEQGEMSQLTLLGLQFLAVQSPAPARSGRAGTAWEGTTCSLMEHRLWQLQVTMEELLNAEGTPAHPPHAAGCKTLPNTL